MQVKVTKAAEDNIAVPAGTAVTASKFSKFLVCLQADGTVTITQGNVAASLAWRFGDVAEAFARAPHVFRESYYQHRGGPHSMEGRGVIAQFEAATDQLTMWSSTQSPFLVRRFIAQYLEREESGIRVIAPDVGGGFGPKAGHYPEELLAAIVAAMGRAAFVMRIRAAEVVHRNLEIACARIRQGRHAFAEAVQLGLGPLLHVQLHIEQGSRV